MPAYERPQLPRTTQHPLDTLQRELPKTVAARPFPVRLLCQEWMPRVETTLVADVMRLNTAAPGRPIHLLYDEKDVQIPTAFAGVLRRMGVQLSPAAMDHEKEQDTLTLIFYTNRADKPQALCKRDNAYYRYVGNEASPGPRISKEPFQEVVFPDRSRPLPPGQSLTHFPSPYQMKYHSKLPFGWDYGPLMG